MRHKWTTAQACVIMNQDGYPSEIPMDKRWACRLFWEIFGMERYPKLQSVQFLLEQQSVAAIEKILAEFYFFKKNYMHVP